MIRSAVMSPCEQYRYRLARQWEENGKAMTFVMLNPSTADAELDDPTIRRCIGYAQREACGGLRVVNLFAYRATDPAQLQRASDPVGPDNDQHLVKVFQHALYHNAPIVAGWGKHGWLNGRAQEVEALAASLGVRFRCLGQNRDGSPVHPLYQPADARLVEML